MGLFSRKSDDNATTGAADSDLAALSGDYTIDPGHSSIGFVARHAMVTNVKGSFTGFEGTLHLDGSDPSKSTATLDVAMGSVETGSAHRDGHLKRSDFFRTKAFPQMTFRSTNAEALGDDDYRITSDLATLGTTGKVSVALKLNGAATDPFGHELVAFEGKSEILRSERGLGWEKHSPSLLAVSATWLGSDRDL